MLIIVFLFLTVSYSKVLFLHPFLCSFFFFFDIFKSFSNNLHVSSIFKCFFAPNQIPNQRWKGKLTVTVVLCSFGCSHLCSWWAAYARRTWQPSNATLSLVSLQRWQIIKQYSFRTNTHMFALHFSWKKHHRTKNRHLKPKIHILRENTDLQRAWNGDCTFSPWVPIPEAPSGPLKPLTPGSPWEHKNKWTLLGMFFILHWNVCWKEQFLSTEICSNSHSISHLISRHHHVELPFVLEHRPLREARVLQTAQKLQAHPEKII